MNEKKYGRLDAVIDSGTNPNAIKEELMDELDEELDEDLEEDEKVIDQFGDETLSADALEGQLALNSSTQLG
ncbi:MAG: hypothetical protein ACXVCD_17970, partial [Pseudobdellovibrionaceae bacterium]